MKRNWEQFNRERKQGFEEFRKLSAPANLVNDSRIVGGKRTAEELETLFREIVELDLQSLVGGFRELRLTFLSYPR